ncbi:hypothetical protein [Gordonia sp. NB41Y]|uniref:hypothetical protein n=1 Tax=Gordonia sp. NB41Y TaxID=875808 RepID=UPI0006B1F4BF|nr:hypothetical protein [Gordonia sp. NB41Y]KOY49945.1 hypothetical protein ISGA_06665 [Gordonia sp. NB41Y]WLP88835.1 hypothetical protein Q9K23_14585 [Gordonia sp. NB41Y]
MDQFLHFAGQFWWLIFPIGALTGGWARSLARYNEKRRQDKIELARIKAAAATERLRITQADAAQVKRTLARHDEVQATWFAYELDLATLIEYPMLIDMREPLTRAFHEAKVRADDLRPRPEATLDPESFAAYRDAVQAYVVAFDAAEREARRRKQSDFSPIERESLDRARKLIGIAADDAATPAERQAAYRRARAELDGLIDVPPPAAEVLERGIAGELERGHD